MQLRIHHPDAEPYPLDRFMLNEAIEAEATNVVSEANSDHLEENTDEARDQLHAQVVRDATAALCREGDEYRDPIGIRWSLAA